MKRIKLLQREERLILHNSSPLYDENVTFLRVRISARSALAHAFLGSRGACANADTTVMAPANLIIEHGTMVISRLAGRLKVAFSCARFKGWT